MLAILCLVTAFAIGPMCPAAGALFLLTAIARATYAACQALDESN